MESLKLCWFEKYVITVLDSGRVVSCSDIFDATHIIEPQHRVFLGRESYMIIGYSIYKRSAEDFYYIEGELMTEKVFFDGFTEIKKTSELRRLVRNPFKKRTYDLGKWNPKDYV